MKLLQDFIRRRLAGLRTAAARPAAVPRDFNVTVPAPLAAPASGSAAQAELPQARIVRREPASFLRSPRHLRLGSGRR